MSMGILSTLKKDESYMQKCITFAKKGAGYVSPNPLVGCVIVRNGKIIAKGYHHEYGEKHAEIDALNKIAGKAEGATLYVNLEPCCIHGKTPPCTERIIKEKIGRVVIGGLDKNPLVSGKGIKILKAAEIEIASGVLETECQMLNQFFFKWVNTGLPYVTLKIAKTFDGFVAGPNGKQTKITGEKSQKETHRLRSFYDAILIGKNTALKDNPKLTVRKVKGRQPFRVVLDSRGEILGNQNLNLLNDKYANKTMVITGKNSLKDTLKKLGEKGISSVLVEGGPTVWESFIKENLVDQLIVFTSPKKLKKGIYYSKNWNPKNLKTKKTLQHKSGNDLVETIFLNVY
ncbi:bifunctional diaminohydroxyphosphoribosylaminopyrimidine deaminase/5-amino-6-(5-phosphoribosylamino)uracil reductase RibD [bacterium]|nr:bifunctional diaminohydroxyphosphoribosylaminopyrimidine deaminase/5-amino-6-(5-phosphoribosylamino)uracil reductase RibD [bacterium]